MEEREEGIIDETQEAQESHDAGTVDPAAAVELLALRVRDLEEQLLRLHADFDNYRRRVRRDEEDAKQRILADVVRPWLQHLDNLDRASTAATGDAETIRQGVQMTVRALRDHLASLGVTPVEAEGTAFDPRFHEALMEEESDATPPGTVLAELQRGWRLGDMLLRPALVKVARGAQPQS